MSLAFVAILGVLLVVAVTSLAPKVGIAPPLLLVFLGCAVTYLPFARSVSVPSEWILAGVLPALLYSAAVNARAMEFRRDFRLISAFSVVLVVASALGVGWVISALVPGMPLALGIALGAIVSPTDAVATSIVRKAGVSTRIVTILDGESMLNDASALVLLRSAVAGIAVSVSLWHVALSFVWAVAAAVGVGFVVGRLTLLVQARVRHVAANVALSLVVPYLAFFPAEYLGASGLVASVTAGLVTGLGAAGTLGPEDRLTQAAVWGTIELLLESSVFLLVGLEIRSLAADLVDEGGSFKQALWLAVVAATLVLAIRALFVAGSLRSLKRRTRGNQVVREQLNDLKDRLDEGRLPRAGSPNRPEQALDRIPDAPAGAQASGAQAKKIGRWRRMVSRRLADLDYLAAEHLGWREGVILFFAGMRGAVTIAAAQSLARNTPDRALVVLVASMVAVGTLLVQGATLGWIAARLGLSGTSADSDPALWAELQADLARAALQYLEVGRVRDRYPATLVEPTRKWLDQMHAVVAGDDPSQSRVASSYIALRVELIEAERRRLLSLRSEGAFPSGLLDAALTQLDSEQMSVERRRVD